MDSLEILVYNHLSLIRSFSDRHLTFQYTSYMVFLFWEKSETTFWQKKRAYRRKLISGSGSLNMAHSTPPHTQQQLSNEIKVTVYVHAYNYIYTIM